jgi:hypothetical protein
MPRTSSVPCSSPAASERLRLTLELVVPALALPGRILLEHPRARELFPRYLVSAYQMGSPMVPLMETALARSRELAGGDPVAAGLAEYLEHHIPEEMHSDEPGGAVLDDLEALGVDVGGLRTELPPPEVAALIGAQYYWIFHHHPVAILGFLELEAYHPHTPTVEQLIDRTGLPRNGFRQLLLHAKLDVAHARELHRVLDSLPLEPWQERLITTSALQTIASVVDLLLDVVQDDGAAA